MTNRFTLGISLAFLAVLAVGILAAVGVTYFAAPAALSPQPIATAPTPSLPAAASSSTAEVSPMRLSAPAIAPVPQPAASVSAMPTGLPVQKSDLDSLAAAVNLGQPNAGGVSKEVWARETPIAQQLLRGVCDCDQRNWLKHFVKTGNDAMSGSEDYYQSVQLLTQLRRSDQDVPVNLANH